jgi:hypothetical protein
VQTQAWRGSPTFSAGTITKIRNFSVDYLIITLPMVLEKQCCFSKTLCWNCRFPGCSRAPINQAPRYHAKLNFYLMVSMSAASLHATNTMKNTMLRNFFKKFHFFTNP